MYDEYSALIYNGTSPRPPATNIISSKWIFGHKFHADGSLARYKEGWVVRGFYQ